MKLSELKGKKQVKVIGKLLGLVSMVSDGMDLKGTLEELKGKKDSGVELLALVGPALERDDVSQGLVEIVAYAKGVSVEEAEEMDIFGEVVELFASDSETPGFLSGAQ